MVNGQIDIGAFEFQTSLIIPDLVVKTVSPPTEVPLGKSFVLRYQVENSGTGPVDASWIDSVVLSRDMEFGSDDLLLDRISQQRVLEPSASYIQEVDVAIPAFDGFNSNQWNILVRTDARLNVVELDNNNNAASGDVVVSFGAIPLPLDVTSSTTLSAREELYFEVERTPNQPLVITLDGLPTDGAVELFAYKSSFPNSDSLLSSNIAPFVSTQEIVLPPDSEGGPLLILVRAQTLASDSATFDLTASETAYRVTTSEFGSAGNAGEYTLAAQGVNLNLTTEVRVIDNRGLELFPVLLRTEDQIKLFATFDLRGVAPGTYDVVFTNEEGEEITVPQSLTVIATEEPVPVIPRIIAPSGVRRGREFSFTVEWENTSANDVFAPLITVGNTVPFGLERGDYSLGTRYTFLGINTQGGPAGILRPGQRESITFYSFSELDGGDYEVYVDRVYQDPTIPFDWQALRSQLIPVGLTDEEFDPIFQELIDQVGSTTGDYLEMLARNANLVPTELRDPRDPNVLLSQEVQGAWAAVSPSISGNIQGHPDDIQTEGVDFFARNLESGELYFTISIRDGQFTLPGITPGTYVFESEGLIFLNPPLVVEGGDSLSGVTLTIGRGATINGTVTIVETEVPVSGATITLASTDSEVSIVKSTLTDELGNYSFSGIPAGNYRLTASLAGLSIATQEILNVDLGNTLTADLVVEDAGEVLVTVIDEANGEPVPNAFVFLSEPNAPDAIRTLQTDSLGLVTFDDLPEGNYDISAALQNFSTNSQVDVSVTAGETKAVTLTLSETGGLTGRVVDASNFALSGIQVAVEEIDGTVLAAAVTDENGDFEFGRLDSGSYSLSVFATPSRRLFLRDAEVTASTTTNLGDLQVPIIGLLEGTVVNNSGTGLEDVTVVVLDSSGNQIFSTDSGTLGEFRIGISKSGTYRIEALSSEATFAPVDVSIESGNTTVNLTGGTNTISGQVRMPQGGVAGATVVAQLFEGGGATLQSVVATTNENGDFHFDQLIDGTYEIRVFGEGIGLTSTNVLLSSQDITGLKIEPVPERVITGTVLDDNGAPIPNAVVQVFSADQAIVLASVFADSSGGFSIGGLAPGLYDLTAVADKLTTGRLNGIDLVDSSGSDSSIQLGASGLSVSGTVINSDGIPIPNAPVVVYDTNNDRWIQEVQTDNEGRFLIENLPAEQIITQAIVDGYLPSSVGAVNLELDPTPVDQILISTSVGAELFPGTSVDFDPEPISPGAWLVRLLTSVDRSSDEPTEPNPPECEEHQAAYNRALQSLEVMNLAYDGIGTSQKDLGATIDANFLATGQNVSKLVADVGLLLLNVNQVKRSVEYASSIDLLTSFDTLLKVGNSLEQSARQLRDTIFGGGAPSTLQDRTKEVVDLLVAFEAESEKLRNTGLAAVGSAGGLKPLSVFNLWKSFGQVVGIVNIVEQLSITIKSISEAIDDIVRGQQSIDFAVNLYQFRVELAIDAVTKYNQLTCESEEEPEEPDDQKGIVRPASFDPNDIIGPAGFGPENYILVTDLMPYTIRFENDPEKATAPAAIVSITQTLDPDLDLTTFRLGDVGFGDNVIEVPGNSAFFQTRFDAVDTLGVFVDIEAGIDTSTREVSWTFTAIDPLTGDLPEDPFVGFLPPNVNAPEGDGFVTYTIRPKSDVVSGDRIDAVASIVFDVNEPIITPPIFNTFDTAPGTSSVSTLPTVVDTTDFLVSWSGQDDAGGSGIASYDIYVSVDDKPFVLWLSDTTETSALYPGQEQTKYAFYSIATDNLGFVEEKAPLVEAETVVLPTPVAELLVTRAEEVDGEAQITVKLNELFDFAPDFYRFSFALSENELFDSFAESGLEDEATFTFPANTTATIFARIIDAENDSNTYRLNVIVGDNDSQEIFGTNQEDIIFGLGGNDIIDGKNGNDTIVGGEGDDTFVANFSHHTYDVIDGGLGTDAVQLNPRRNQNDAISFNKFTPENSIELILGGGRIVGTDEDDVLDFSGVSLWTANNRRIDGKDGNDIIVAPSGLGGFELNAGGGADTVVGGDGNDDIDGGSGSDSITGGGGDDTIEGGAGTDTTSGGIGNDVFIANFSDHTYDIVDGGPDVDSFQLNPRRNQSDPLRFHTFAPSNNIEQILGGSRVVGTDDADILDFSGISFWTASQQRIEGKGGDDTITAPNDLGGFELRGDDGADTLAGGNGDDVLEGGADNDQIDGNEGNDTIDGGAGDDTTRGGEDNDVFINNFSEMVGDVYDGGEGIDAVKLNPKRNQSDPIRLASLTPANGIEQLLGGGRIEGTGSINAFDFSSITTWATGKTVRTQGGNDVVTTSTIHNGQVYDGGSETDTINIRLTQAQFDSLSEEELAELLAFIDDPSGKRLDIDKDFFALSVLNFENATLVIV